MLLLYIVMVIAYCYVLDALWEAVSRRRFRDRVREVRARVRATLLARGKRHV
jgi:hypothetical protein